MGKFDEEGNLRGPNYYFTKDWLTPTEEEKVILRKIRKRYQELMEENMKDLKRGDFVWSKRYGNGIVTGAADWISIMFEGQNDIMNSARADLFAKGDKVMYKDNKTGIFLGITHHQGMRCGILIILDVYDCIIFASDIKHKPIDKLEVILTLNGKEIDVKAISKETWDNLRRIE